MSGWEVRPATSTRWVVAHWQSTSAQYGRGRGRDDGNRCCRGGRSWLIREPEGPQRVRKDHKEAVYRRV